MAKKHYIVKVNASPKYVIKETFNIEANNFTTAITKALKMYFKKHKGWRTDFCDVTAEMICMVSDYDEQLQLH